MNACHLELSGAESKLAYLLISRQAGRQGSELGFLDYAICSYGRNSFTRNDMKVC